MPTHGYKGNCSSEAVEVSAMLFSKISSNMANYSACVALVGSCYVFRTKCMCNGTFGTSHVYLGHLSSVWEGDGTMLMLYNFSNLYGMGRMV